MKIKRGSTSVRRLIFIADSSSTTGAGLANLAHNSAGLVAYYFAGDLSNEVQITLATATLGTYTSGGFVAVDNTNMPGWYEIGIPDAALDGGNECAIQLRGATNMVPVNVYIELDAFDYQTATQPVNVTQISGDATAADNLEAALDGTGGVTLSVVLGTDAITAASLADSAGAELAALVETYIVNEGDATAVMQAIADKIAADWVAGDASPLAIVAAIKADATIATMISRVDATVSSRSSHAAADVLNALGTGTWATAIPWNAAWDAEVQSEVQDAIEANHLDHLLAQTYDPASKPGAADALLNELIGNDAGVSQFTANALELAPSGGGGGGSGTGARTVTITVNDGTTALQNATVRLTEGANTFTASTNASGVATFNVDDATYTVAITKDGYSYSGTTLVVDGDESATYSMTATTITPSTGDQTTGYLTTLDETGQAEAGVSIYVSVADVPNDYGLALDEATRTITSDEDGLVEITGMVKGATYNLRRGLKGRLFPVTIPTTAGSTYELPNMAGT